MNQRKHHCEWLLMQSYLFLQVAKAHRAVPLLEAAHVLQPEDDHTLNLLCYAYLADEQFGKALKLQERHTSANSSQWYLLCAKAHWGAGDTEKAKQYFKQYVNSRGSHSEQC